MRSDLPKVLHPMAGAPLLHHALASAAPLDPARVVVVAGHGADQVEAAAQTFLPAVETVVQSEQLGTAHAVACAKNALAGFEGDAIVLYADTPLIQPETLEQMVAARATHDVVVLGFDAADPARYGRLIMGDQGLERIVEYKDASPEERAVTLCNSGIIAANSATLFDLVDAVDCENEAGEYYLPDIVAIARERGLSVTAVLCPEAQTLGVNTKIDLANAEAAFQSIARQNALENGVTLQAPETVFFALDTYIGGDTVIEPNVVFGPGTELSENVRIGNFVEVKNATIAEAAKVNHLSYIGDADVGTKTNIGAGTITCNYDGVMKHHTTIGADAFIGSNTMLIAPVTVADEAMTASGSVITSDVAEGALAISRAKQANKPGLARKLFEKLRAQKAKRQKDLS
ncbi:UNVERIFIED_CONTAM: hypothetical protein GTU68_022094 [Idotea baltica]|nr:hypothetical protein [Idotea baltica]